MITYGTNKEWVVSQKPLSNANQVEGGAETHTKNLTWLLKTM
jgi:hypothetical protein